MIRIILIGLSAFSLNSYALSQSECTTLNILNAPNLPAAVREHFSRPFNQYGTQLCYAHASADILSVISGQSISPVALAISAGGSDFNPDNAGEVPHIFDHINSTHSACSNAGFNSRITEAQYDNLPSRVTCPAANVVRFPRRINSKFYRDCLSGQIPRRVLPESYKETILAAIYSELSRNYPVAVSIYSTLLDPVKEGQVAEAGGAHVMTVIGRKWNSQNSTCDLVIRNSYGNSSCGDWDQTRQGLNCNSESLGNGFPSSGVFSVSEALFKQVLHRVTMINHETNPAEVTTVVTPADICRPEPEARNNNPKAN